MPRRRPLHFDSLADVRREAQRLLQNGYQRAGNWSLGTMGDHLGRAMSYSREGFPRIWPRAMQFVARAMALHRIVARKRLTWRFPAPISVNWQVTDHDGVDCLSRGIERFEQPDSVVFPHVILGKLTREQWVQFHLWHCEHHLSFLLPEGAQPK